MPSHLLAGPLLWLVMLSSGHAAQASLQRTIPMNQKQMATYYVDVSLAGHDRLEFMVDTGAGYTTINEDTLALLLQVDNAVYLGQLTGVMADGSEQRLPLYRIKRLVVGKDCVLSNIEAAVFPRNTRMLLGLSALEKAAPFVFSTDPPRLSLSHCGSTSG
jgi:predicted aspartyl protease